MAFAHVHRVVGVDRVLASPALQVTFECVYVGTDVPHGMEVRQTAFLLQEADSPTTVQANVVNAVTAEAATHGFTVLASDVSQHELARGS